MCGRFTQKMTWKEIHTLYRIRDGTTPANLRARYNGWPTQDFVTCRLDDSGTRSIAKLRWGLVPRWAKDLKMGSRLINARAETVHEKPAFRAAFQRRRYLVPANGWMEWRNEGSRKQPYVITAHSDEPLSFAGLWERWDNDGEAIESFTILTTVASLALADLHHRQAAIIEADDFGEWLEPGTAPERLLALAQRAYQGPFDRWAVSRRVNNARNNDPDVLLRSNE